MRKAPGGHGHQTVGQQTRDVALESMGPPRARREPLALSLCQLQPQPVAPTHSSTNEQTD